MVKKCCTCKKELPKTTEYFYVKIIKQFNAKGELKIYNSLTSDCKKCRAEKNDVRRIKKRCKEMNCDISEYRENWKAQYTNTRTKNKDLRDAGLTFSVATNVRKWIENGYTFTSYEQYRIDCRKKYSKSSRKYDYGDVDFCTKKQLSTSGLVNLTDSYIALRLGHHVADVPKKIIETKRLILKINREFKKSKS